MSKAIRVSMPGTIIKILVSPGEHFSRGDVLAVLESMKMEMVIEAETSGTVETLQVEVGDVVEEDCVLLTYV